MRQIVLDTETTGLEVGKGHRIVEIGCVELLERRPRDKFFRRVNPERAIDEGARAVTGISEESLQGEKLFAQIVDEFLDFIGDSELIIHNAAFDIGFLDAELALAGRGDRRLGGRVRVIDTLELAREKYPGQKNSLDALCKRLGVDNAHRQLHGALLDAELLADVYLAMTAGQGDLGLALAGADASARAAITLVARPAIRVYVASGDEISAHAARLAAIDATSKGRCRWSAPSLQ